MALPSGGVGGIAADDRFVVIASRDPSDQRDLVECYDAATGTLLWGAFTPASGNLDYGNSPRSTPLISDGFVYTLGAFGDLSALDLETGVLLWTKNLVRDLAGKMPDWGYSASPILLDETLVVQPGGEQSALVGLDSLTGETIWQSPGKQAVYASMVVHLPDGQPRLIGMDAGGVCGWDSQGVLLWRREPKIPGDFGVPTPLPTPYGLVACSENNGTRLFPWQPGTMTPAVEPAATVAQADPNSHTPVAVKNRLIVAGRRLECYDLANGLQPCWTIHDRDLKGYVSLLASPERLLACTQNGTLVLIDLKSGDILDRLKLTDQSVRILAHPALVGRHLYVRVHDSLMRIDL